MSIHSFGFPTPISFGPGSRSLLPEKIKENHLRRTLLVTDSGLAKIAITDEISDLISKSADTEVFSAFEGNPVLSHVTAGVDAAKKFNADSIVALGGGAALDVAKAIALMVHHPGHLFDYEDGKPDARPMDKDVPYVIAIPTTAGTGSEVGRSSVVSDDKTHAKKIIFGPKLLPKHVIADPELTTGLPKGVTAATGMDALTHLVEAYVAKGWHPMCDGIALEGIRLVSQSLSKAVHEGANIEARSNMLVASLMGAVAFQKGLGVTHSCAHSLSTHCDTHHGLANGVMIIYAMKFNEPVCKARFQTIAETVRTKAFLPWLDDLRKEISMPDTLSEIGVTKDKVSDLTKTAFKDICHQLNPRPVTEQDFTNIYNEAMG